jgi:serine protease Do
MHPPLLSMLSLKSARPRALEPAWKRDQVHGVVVQSVRPASPADEAGIQAGDVIVEVNRKPAQSASQFVSEVHQNREGKDLLLLVWSKGNASYRTVHPDQDKPKG